MDNVTRVRFPRHEHDHLCPIKHEEHITRENCTFCTLIDATRADERKQAAQRVAGLLCDDDTQWDQAVNHAIDAAKGDTP